MTAEARTYRIVAGGVTLDRLRTAPASGLSADELAVQNLTDYSRHHRGLLTLEYLDGDGCTAALAEARAGVSRLLADRDAVAADAMHCGPAVVADPDVARTWPPFALTG